MNAENCFFLVRSRSVYTEEDVEAYRTECLESMVVKNRIDAQRKTTITAPTDLASKLDELVQKNMTEIGITNCWPIYGSLINEKSYHGWNVVFEPPIPTHDKIERKTQLFGGILGGDREARRNKTEFLKKVFGHIAFDNQNIWTTKNEVPDGVDLDVDSRFIISKNQFNTSYDIIFIHQGEATLAGIPLQEAERLIHLSVLRPALELAGFVKDGPQERKWFPKHGHPLYNVTTVSEFRDEIALDVIAGYRITVHLRKKKKENGKELAFPVLKISTQSRLDINDTCLTMLNRGFEKCKQMGKDFRSKADERDRFIGRSAYVIYGGHRNMTINEIDWESNEKTLITGQNLSVGDYLLKTYPDDVKEVSESPCTFKRTVGSDEHFLPQFVRLTAKSSDSPMNYGKALELMSKSPVNRMKDIQNVCSNIGNAIKNSEELGGKVSIHKLQTKVDMIHLENPKFIVQSKRGNKMEQFSPTDLPSAWGRNAGGPIRDDKIAFGPTVPLKQWKIVYFHLNHLPNAEQLAKHVEAYRGMRKLDKSGLIQAPELVQLYWRDEKTEVKDYQRTVSSGDQALLIILPPRVGSWVKTHYTKAVHYTNHPAPPHLQFILAENCFNKNAALAAISNTLAKIGNVMYKLAEPYTNAYGHLGNAWVVGVDVAHNGSRKPSIACMALLTKPLCGTTKFWRPSCVPNSPRQEILGGRMADGLMRSLLEDVYDQELQPQAKKTNKTFEDFLPSCLVIIRDGLADDQIYECLHEEMVGIDSAIKKFSKSRNINWKPKIVALISPKAGMDDICKANAIGPEAYELNNPGMPSKPVVILPRDMHRSWFEFFLLGNPKDFKAKPRRYILVRDDLGVTDVMRNFNCLCNYILALMWGFCMAIPFSTGCSSQPCPVKVAKHYAELLSQLMLGTDENFDKFSVNRWNRPNLVIKNPLPAVATEMVVE